MSTVKHGGPAFPITDPTTVHRVGQAAIEGVIKPDDRDRIYIAATVRASQGMTLRDYFAAKVMQGMFASDTEYWNEEGNWSARAEASYAMADAMLNAREQT